MRQRILFGSLLLTAWSGAVWCPAQEWTRFRGPSGAGQSVARTIPAQWTESDINWRLELPGPGHSSPVLWGDHLFLTCTRAAEGGFMAVCISATEGRLLWRKDFPLTPHRQHRYNSFASSSPAADAQRVYVTWTTPEHNILLALDHQGHQVWQRDLGPYQSQHGGGTSPVVYEDKVILANEQDGTSYILAVDSATGETAWQTPRQTAQAAYGTAYLHQPAGDKPQLLFSSQAHGVYALDPDSGRVLWEYAEAFDKRSVSSPMVAGGLVFGSCGSGGGGNYVVAVKPPAAPGETPTLAYQIRRSAPYVPTSVAFGDLVFLWSDGGVVTCLDAPTGKTHWSERVGGDYFASPICVDGKVYNISTTGEMVVLAASDQYQLLARNPLGELSRSTPAVANGRMYVRTETHLYSVGGGAGQ